MGKASSWDGVEVSGSIPLDHSYMDDLAYIPQIAKEGIGT